MTQYANICLCGNYIPGKHTHNSEEVSTGVNIVDLLVYLWRELLQQFLTDCMILGMHDQYQLQMFQACFCVSYLCVKGLCSQSAEFYALGCWYFRHIKLLSVIAHFYKIDIASLQNHKMNYGISVFTWTPFELFFHPQNYQKRGSLPNIFRASPKPMLLKTYFNYSRNTCMCAWLYI